MRFSEDNSPPFSIQSCSKDGIVIDGRHIGHSVLVSETALQEWPVCSIADITTGHIAQCSTLKPDVLIIGTGKSQQFLPAQFMYELQQQGIGVEVMKNDAACRTFNVLLSENRNVVLALIQDEQ